MADTEITTLLQVLVQQQALTDEQVKAITESQPATLHDLTRLLIGEYNVDDNLVTRALAAVMNMPYVELRGQVIARDVLGIIPESTAREHLIVPYDQTETVLRVAMADPTDRQIIEFVRKKVDRPIEVALCSESAIREILNQYQESLEIELKNIIQEAVASGEVADDSKAAEDVPIIRVVDAILKHAVLQHASDIHIEPLEDKVLVRYRIDGLLADKLVLPKKMIVGIVARIKILSNLKIDEHRLPQDGRFKISNDEFQVAFRVSILPVFDGEKIVMRLLDESGHGLGLDDIGMTPKALNVLRRNLNKPHGMVLVTGPTGSGKTTTLYAAMKELNTPDVNISTIEDPIEYRMPRVNQTQVKPQIGLTFANGLRSLVRQDPDIIMVGEIRDAETASLAINAALTGHLVLSTLHTNSAAGALPRLLDMGVEPFLVASTANALMAQRLVRRLCDKCRKQTTITKPLLDTISQVFHMERLLETLKREQVVGATDAWETVPVFQAVGCSLCSGGYKGRLGIYEIIEMTPSIQQLVSSNVTAQKVEEAARTEQQMVTMLEDGFIKVVTGLTTVEEVLRVAKE